MNERSDAFSFEQQLRHRHARQFRLRTAFSVLAASALLVASAPWLPPTSIGAIDGLIAAVADVLRAVRESFAPVLMWLEAALSRAPAVSLGLVAIAVTVPLVAVGAVVRGAIAGFGGGAEPIASARDAHTPTGGTGEYASDTTGRARPARAWLSREDDGGTPRRHHLDCELTRIGRAADNEIRLNSRGVDRYHAAVKRSAEFDFHVVALSGSDGRIEVNGQPVARSRLRPGDVVAIGGVRFVFGREEP